MMLFPDVSWELVYKIELLTVTISSSMTLLFIASLFPDYVSKILLRLVVGTGLIFSIIVIFSSTITASHIVKPNQYMILFSQFYIIFILLRALLKKEHGAGIILCGFIVFFSSVIHDILGANKFIYQIHMLPFGVFFLIFSQSFVLFRRFANAFRTIEKLSVELEERNIALSRLDRVKDEFLANTSHELRTPLNGIIGIAESVREGAFGRLPEKVRDNLSLIASSGRRLAGLINDILDFSRLKGRDIRLQRGPVDIRRLADTVLAVLKQLAKDKDLVLTNRIPHGIPCLCGDEMRLQQILYNLVGNALKFTEAGEVSVTAAERDAVVEVAVADTGIGIPPEHLDTIFESFEQVDATAARRHAGAGLGLSITKHLVELHGGEIRVDSEPGKGTTFRFTVPVSDAPKADQRPLAAVTLETVADEPSGVHIPVMAEHESTPGEESVLVVDDDPVNLQVVVNHLSLLEISVAACKDGREALDRIEGQDTPDLILLDIMMPGMSGYEVCRRIRVGHTPQEVPVIMLTARNRVPDLVEGFNSGANDYLTKPFTKDELLARVTTQLKLKQAYETYKENVRLKKEMSFREQTEQELKMVQRRLSGILDTIDEAVLAINASKEIGFCNRSFEALTGYSAPDLLGNSYEAILPDPMDEAVKAFTADLNTGGLCPGTSKNYSGFAINCADNSVCKANGILTLLEMEDELFHLFILRDAPQDAHTVPSFAPTLGRIQDLNRNRERLHTLEASLNRLTAGKGNEKRATVKVVKEIDGLLDHLEQHFTDDSGIEKIRDQAVAVMNLSVDYWTASTRTSKVELADRSGIWNVYIGRDGWARTQTLDRYLSNQTLPMKPRWRQVVNTADFVLVACDAPSSLRDRLEESLSKLRTAVHE
jgi:two-component system, sensor histidine kinase ChiS